MDLTLLSAGIDASGASSGAARFNDALDSMADRTESVMSKVKTLISSVKSDILNLPNLIAGISFGGLVREIMSASQAYDRIMLTLKAVSGESGAASYQFKQLSDMAYKYGQSLPFIAQQYGLMNAAARNTSLEGAGVDKVFKALTITGSALGLSQEQVQRLFQATEHMMSRQTITAQDLRRQLGNNLPGAMQLSAQAMGVSVAQLNAMMKSGSLLARDLLPKLADQLINQYGKAAEEAAGQTRGLVANVQTALFELETWMAHSGLGSAVNDMLKNLTTTLRSDGFKQAAAEFATVLAGAVNILAKALILLMQHARLALGVLGMFGALKIGTFFSNLYTQVNKVKNALLELESVQTVVSRLDSVINRPAAAPAVARSEHSGMLMGKAGALTQDQLNVRMTGSKWTKAWEEMSSYERVQLAAVAEQQGQQVAVTLADKLKATATAPMRAGTAAASSVRDAIGSAWAHVKLSRPVLGFQSPDPQQYTATAYSNKFLPKDLEYLFNNEGKVSEKLVTKKTNQPSWMMGNLGNFLEKGAKDVAQAEGKDPSKVKADLEALNFVFSKSGTILSDTALKAKLSGQAYQNLGSEAQIALRGITDALGATEAEAPTLLARFGGFFSGIGAMAKDAAVSVGEVVTGALGTFAPWAAALVLAIGGVAAALYGLRDKTIEIGGHTATVGNYIGVVWDKVKSGFEETWSAAVQWFKDLWSGLVSWFDKMADSLGVSAGWKKVEDLLGKFDVMRKWSAAAENRQKNGPQTFSTATDTMNQAVHDGADRGMFKPPAYAANIPPTPRHYDDGGIQKPQRMDPYKVAVDEIDLQIAKYKEILKLDDSRKLNQVQINALTAANQKILELERSGKEHLSQGQQNNLRSLYLQEYQLKDRAEAKTSMDSMNFKAQSDGAALDAQMAYLQKQVSSVKDFRNGMDDLQASMQAYDKVSELVGRVDDSNLQRTIAMQKANIEKKKSIDEEIGAYQTYIANMAEAAQVTKDYNAESAKIMSGDGKRKKDAGFDPKDVLQEANLWADQKQGKDAQKFLSPDDYTKQRQGLINEYTSKAYLEYAKGLQQFADSATQADGDISGLVENKKKLDEAFSHKMINADEYAVAIKDIQQQWDQSVDTQLAKTNTWQSGILLGMREIQRQSTDTANMMRNAFTSAFQSLQDKLVSFLDTGKFSMKGFGEQIRHQFDTILVQKTTGGLMGMLLGNADNTYGNKGVGQSGAGATGLAKWLGVGSGTAGVLGMGGSTKNPTGTAMDPIYVALTTGSSSDFSGIPQKLGGAAQNAVPADVQSSPTASSAPTAAAAASSSSSLSNWLKNPIGQLSNATGLSGAMSSLGNSSLMQTISKGIKDEGFAGLASNGGATGSNAWTNVPMAFLKSFMGQMSPYITGQQQLSALQGIGATQSSSLMSQLTETPATGLLDSGIDTGINADFSSFGDDFMDDIFAFANGGVMTSKGVRKYSKGGIANSPQLAMFGEGRTPEAYVPLPDGKTIPVNINGNGASTGGVQMSHTTNIYDQTGRGVDVQQKQSFDGQSYIQQIFIQDLQQEGPMSQGLRSYFGER